jgi:hypothetical protein
MSILLLSALLASLSLVVFGDTCFASPPSSSARFKSTVMHRRSTLSVSYKDWPSLRCTRGAHIELSSRRGLFGRGRHDGHLGDGDLGDGRLGDGHLGYGRLGDGHLGDGRLGDGRLGDWCLSDGRLSDGRRGSDCA